MIPGTAEKNEYEGTSFVLTCIKSNTAKVMGGWGRIGRLQVACCICAPCYNLNKHSTEPSHQTLKSQDVPLTVGVCACLACKTIVTAVCLCRITSTMEETTNNECSATVCSGSSSRPTAHFTAPPSSLLLAGALALVTIDK